MANKRFRLGMLVMVLVFGIAVVGSGAVYAQDVQRMNGVEWYFDATANQTIVSNLSGAKIEFVFASGGLTHQMYPGDVLRFYGRQDIRSVTVIN